jgi:hypothetical protein
MATPPGLRIDGLDTNGGTPSRTAVRERDE